MGKESRLANELQYASSLNIRAGLSSKNFINGSLYKLSMTGWTGYAKAKLNQFKTPRTSLAAVESKFLALMNLEKSSAQRIGEWVP